MNDAVTAALEAQLEGLRNVRTAYNEEQALANYNEVLAKAAALDAEIANLEAALADYTAVAV